MTEMERRELLLKDIEQLFESLRPGETQDGSYVNSQFGAIVEVCRQRGFTLTRSGKGEA